MAARGTEAKQQIMDALIKLYPNAFMNGNKEFRIPLIENGELVEIKVVLTCAKDLVGSISVAPETFDFSAPAATAQKESPEPSAQEQENLRRLMQALNF